MTSKEFLNRLKNIDMIYKTDENGNVSEIISCEGIYENHFKKLEKDLEVLEIIRQKGIDIGNLEIAENKEEYNNRCEARLLTNEEYKLLKEWLDK